MKTIGVIGTAKNTGKTTTLSFLMKGFFSREVPVGLTGIGYDGEDVDNITNLPKPRLFLEENTFAATSEKCLITSGADYELIAETGLQTALGKISLVRITKPGLMVIAGPNTKEGLAEVTDLFRNKTSAGLLLVDGSLNRLSPMYILEKLIFTTGASRDTNISGLAAEMSFIEKVFGFKLNTDIPDGKELSIKVKSSEGETALDTYSLVDEDDLALLINQLNDKTEKVYLPGLFSHRFLGKNLMKIFERIRKPAEFVFNSPVQLLLTDESANLSFLLSQFAKNNISISYRYKPELSAITINPFYPNIKNYSYEAAYINKDEFLHQMTQALHTPVFNIYEPGADKIFNLL
ncbi:MAG: hypothetical protein HUU54_10015 [Ignavibacteriaceae bacterium]|nr:hypothetical protein [Ignavibacteriaceae bacterium]